MNKIIKIGKYEAIGFLIIVMINRIIINSPQTIINQVGSSSWINVILITFIAIAIVFIITSLYKNFSGKNILDISNYLGGKVLEYLTAIMFFLIFLFIITYVLKNFSDAIQLIFLKNSPITFIILFFLFAIIIANKLGFASIVRANLLIAPLILFSMIILFITPIFNFKIENLFPIFGNGIKETFISGLNNLFTFSGLVYLYFLMPYLKDTSEFKKIGIISIIISSIYLFLSVITLLALFGDKIYLEDRLSIFLITRIINFGDFLQRVDAIFIFIWILTFMSYLSILMYFTLFTFKKITNIYDTKGIIYLISSLILGLSLLPQNVTHIIFLEEKILKYITFIGIFIIPILILILANLKYKRKNKYRKEL